MRGLLRLGTTLAVFALVTGPAGITRAQDHPASTGQFPGRPPVVRVPFTTSDGFTHFRLDVNSGCSFSDHNYQLEITADPKDMADISYTMSNFDVDYNDPQGCQGGPEVDIMYLNNQALGILTGANNSWSVNSWPLTQTQVVKGLNTIFIDTDAPGTGCWCVGVGYVEVKAKVGFKVTKQTPQDNDKNRDFHSDKVDMTVSFSAEYDTATLTGDTFKLEYRDPSGSYQPVAGTFTQLAPEKFRFTPNAGLKDGVRYRTTVKSGDTGVKSRAGAKLDHDVVQHFWTVPDLGLTDAFDYGAGSVCPPSNSPCPGVELDVFQVARNAKMVPGKEAMTRLYLRWKKHTDVLDVDQVTEMEVDVSVTGGTTFNDRSPVKRPDRYTAAEKAAASHTANTPSHTPAGFNYAVEVSPVPQSNATPVKFTGNRNLAGAGSSPTINFDHYFLKDGVWAAGVPAAVRANGLGLMNAGTQFVTDLFPVVSTNSNERGDFSIGYTFTGTTTVDPDPNGCGSMKNVDCPYWFLFSKERTELECVQLRLQTMRGGHQFVAATVPGPPNDELCQDATAFAIGSGMFMHQSGSSANDGTVAHEVGHIFGISTASEAGVTPGHRNNPVGVEGYQVRTTTNRSNVENPTKALSLMHEAVMPAGTQWIHNDDYDVLLGAAVRSAAAVAAASAVGGYLIVSGYVDTGTATVELAPSFLQELPNDAPSTAGTCAIELLGVTNTVLSSAHVTPGLHVTVHQGSGKARSFSTAQAGGSQYFTVSLPWNPTAASLRISCGGVVLLMQARSPHAPTVDFNGLAEGATLSGVQLLNWSGADTDGPNLAFQLQFSDDGGVTWRPLMPLGIGTSFSLDTTRLPSGPGKQLSIMVTDGFNTAYATRTVTISNPLAVKGLLPANGATGVGLTTTISASFVSAIDIATLGAGAFRVLENGSTPVAGTNEVISGGVHQVVFTPAQPLKPNTNHTAVLAGTVADTLGHNLGAPVSWSFTTGPDTVPPLVVHVSPPEAAINVPLNALAQARFDEAMDAGSLTTASVLLLDPANNPVPGSLVYQTDMRQAVFTPSGPLTPNTHYRGRVTTAAKDVAGNPLETPREWSFTTGTETTPGSVRIIETFSDEAHDTDGDGLYNDLTVYADVEVRAHSTFNLNGRLLDKHGTLLAWQDSAGGMGGFVLNPGVYTFALIFPSVPIRSNGVNGPYTLDALNFYDLSDPPGGDVRFKVFETFAYDVSRFFSVLTLGGLPDQVLETGTTRNPAFNLRDHTTHRTLPVTAVTYTIFINSSPAIGVSIDSSANVNINPSPGVEAESDVTIEARDPLGNRVLSTFHVSVQRPRAAQLVPVYNPQMATNATQAINLDILDQFGRLFTKPVTVAFHTTLGSLNPASTDTSTGHASSSFSSGLAAGTAFVTIAAGATSATISITVTAPLDIEPPSVVITQPTNGPTFVTNTSPLALGGSATDNVAVTQVTWANDRGGIGTAGGTTSWTVPAVPLQPGANMILVTARDAAGNTGTATLTVTLTTFTDVLPTDLFFKWIEALFAAGITAGCSATPPLYCPEDQVTRGQMAVFLERGINGAGYQPPNATGTVFTDVPVTHLFATWIEQLARDGITGGCSTSPPQYCPDVTVTRGQMAVFLLRAKHGAGYQPPAATGMFADVPVSHLFGGWIEQLAREGITGGCSTGPLQYCPEDPATRAQMAVFLVRAFQLPLFGVPGAAAAESRGRDPYTVAR